MAQKIRTKMSLSQRAKQFAPFKAVGGLDEALRRKEEEHRREIESEIELIINPERVDKDVLKIQE